MKTKLMMVVAAAMTIAAQAEPGFIRAEFTDPNKPYSYFDSSSDIWTAPGRTTVTAISDLYKFTTPEYTTYAYAAYMWMECGKVYFFKGQYDDYFSVKVDNTVVISKSGPCAEAAGACVFEQSGWHKIELRASNASGGGGANSSYAYGGIWYKKGKDGSYVKFADSGDGSLFRSEEPEDFIASTPKYTYSLAADGASATVVSANIDEKVATIPSEVDGIPVTAIGNGCFQNNTVVMKVAIPETVTSIGSSAFSGCIALTSVNIPAGVTAIADATFNGCVKLRSVTLPHGVKSIGGSAFRGCSSLAAIEIPEGVTSIGSCAFESCSGLREVAIPDTVTSMGARAFQYCGNLVSVKFSSALESVPDYSFYHCGKLSQISIPEGVTSVGGYAFAYCSALKELSLPASVNSVGGSSFISVGRVIFQGKPPAGLGSASVSTAVYPKEYGEQWRAQFAIANIGGYVNPNKPVVTVVSSKVRENNPTVLDVVYKVTSTKPTVKVRALAFEDGERTLNKVTRPETFIDGTAANLGDAIAANVEHKLSWQVSSDFKTDLAKMKFEVLAVEDGILPLEFISIPANGTNKKMQLSWNLLTQAQVFDALLWLYADKDAGLTLENGTLKNGNAVVATGTAIKMSTGSTYNYNTYTYDYTKSAPEYVFSKMGFSVLSGDKLTYANEMTRLGLSPSGIRQYAWRELND